MMTSSVDPLDLNYRRLIVAMFLGLCFASSGFGQATPESKPDSLPTPTPEAGLGGLFGGLKKLIPSAPPAALRETLDSAWKSGSEGFQSLLQSGSEADAKMEAMLAYLDEKLAGREATFTPEQVAAYTTQIAPLVEELNGRKFSRPPVVKTVGNLQLMQALARDLAPQYEKQFPGVAKPVIYLRCYLSAGLMAPSMLGKYGAEDKALYIVPQNVTATLDQIGVSKEYHEQILQLVIGHELTHALQDEQVDLKKALVSTETPDESVAQAAAIEGHAVMIQDRLAIRLGFTEAAKEATKLLCAGDLEEDAWIQERLTHVQAVQHEQVYLGGRRFIAYHYGQGGIEKVWEVLTHPPQRSSMITQPETYTKTPPPLPDYAAKFAAVPARAGLDSQWEFSAVGLGDFDLRGKIAEVDQAQRERIMRGLTEAVCLGIPHKTDLDRTVEVALFGFKSEEEATLMAQAIRGMTLQGVRDLEKSSLVRLHDKAAAPYTADGTEIGTTWRYKAETYLLGESAVTEIVIRKGTVVANYIDTNSGLSDAQIDALLAESVKRMQ